MHTALDSIVTLSINLSNNSFSFGKLSLSKSDVHKLSYRTQ